MDVKQGNLYSNLVATINQLQQQYKRHDYSKTTATISILGHHINKLDSSPELKFKNGNKNLSSESSSKVAEVQKFEAIEMGDRIIIGKNGTQIKIKEYNNINWNLPTAAIRTLLLNVFDEGVLTTRSRLGSSKILLDSRKVDDIIGAVRYKFDITEAVVRKFIAVLILQNY